MLCSKGGFVLTENRTNNLLPLGKQLGRMGSILSLSFFLAGVPWLIFYREPLLYNPFVFLWFISEILLLFAFNYISQALSHTEVFANYLNAFILSSLVFVMGAIFSFIPELREHYKFLTLISLCYLIWVIRGYFLKECFANMGQALRLERFRLVGSLLFWGSILVIAFGIGIFIYFGGVLLMIRGFLTLPEEVS